LTISKKTLNYHLHLRDVLLPPNFLLVLWLQCGDKVVAVHDNVDETVDPTEERAMTTCNQIAINVAFDEKSLGAGIKVRQKVILVNKKFGALSEPVF
jgi:hypothetical protein